MSRSGLKCLSVKNTFQLLLGRQGGGGSLLSRPTLFEEGYSVSSGAQPSPSSLGVSDSGTKRGRSSRSRAWLPCGKSTPRPGAAWAAPRQATGWHVPSPLPVGLGRGRQHVSTMSRTSNATLERSLGSQVSGGTRFGVLPRSQRAVTPATRRGWVLMTAKSPHLADICKRPTPKPSAAPARSQSPRSPKARHVHRHRTQNGRTGGDTKRKAGPFPGAQSSGPARGCHRAGDRPASHGTWAPWWPSPCRVRRRQLRASARCLEWGWVTLLCNKICADV